MLLWKQEVLSTQHIPSRTPRTISRSDTAPNDLNRSASEVGLVWCLDILGIAQTSLCNQAASSRIKNNNL